MISHVKTDAQGQKCFEDAELIAILIGSEAETNRR
jgi:hypothetical protein